MVKEFKTSEFGKWKANLEPEKNDPVYTSYAYISLDDLNNFLGQIVRDGAKGICIHLLRFDPKTNDPQKEKKIINGETPIGCKWEAVSDTKTQVGIAISGTGPLKVDPSSYVITAEELSAGKPDILLLMPGGEVDGPIGHNPSKTGG